MEHLQGKCVLLCVSGGIAAYKIPNVASALRKAGAEVHVVMTRNATEFITPLTFESLTNHRCVVDTFDRNFPYDIHHISLATAADPDPHCPGHGGCHRQAGPRHCRRYAHHRGPGGQVQKTGGPSHEHRHVGKPHHPGQPEDPGALRLSDHPPGQRPAGPQAVGSGKMPEPGGPLGSHRPGAGRPKTLKGCG